MARVHSRHGDLSRGAPRASLASTGRGAAAKGVRGIGGDPESLAVVVVGGTAGTGKTTLAKDLSTRLGARVLNVDEFRAQLTAHASPATSPGLYEKMELGEAILDLPTASQLELKLRMAREVCRSLEGQIRDQFDQNTVLIVEGDDVLPELAVRFPTGRLRALFILPRSEREVAEREAIRDPLLASGDPDRRKGRMRVTWSYAEWLREEATRRGLSVVDATTSAALIARADRALGLDAR